MPVKGKQKVIKKTTDIILEDILIRLDESNKSQREYNEKVDSRLDAIEKEIVGVKKAVGFVMKLIQVCSWIAAIVTAGLKFWTVFIPKGRGGRNANRKIKRVS